MSPNVLTLVLATALTAATTDARPVASRDDASAATRWGTAVSVHPRVTQTIQKGLRIVIIDGEDAVNIIQQKSAVSPVVEVRDDNDLPVAGVLLRFRTDGKSAAFAGGLAQLTLTTNAAGRAAVTGLQPLASGSYQIEVTATHQGLTATTTITQSNFATVADATKAGRTVRSGPSSGAGAAGGSGAGTAAAAGGGGLSKLAIIGLAGAGAAGAAVAVTAASGRTESGASTPPPPGVTNTPPVVSGVTPSRSTALLGTEVEFSSQASDANNDALTYAWAFGDGVTSTEQSPRHVYSTEGTFTVGLTVSDGRATATQQVAVTIRALTGTWSANATTFVIDPNTGATVRTFPTRIVMTLTQSGTSISGSVVFFHPPGERDEGTGAMSGAVNRTTPSIRLTGNFPPPTPANNLVLALDPGPDVNTLTGSTSRQSLTFTRQ